ncbi:PQQ-binding-like beta-propeller repeat protein [Pyrococcus abyssi]|uniref:Dehydrogenase n=1 Tax=Pyrococcus abyssi (strain GE5 / Orsay) TaxID=272844 RepID=Q9UY79_PYRAB|nr:PQQ-binding-like beta-propeller repeat protein [Pyrococcus abyssi]CAB50533.1 Hypothetical protein PAB1279 [Pyrococcus abyssi GE5]CCE71090.1 TPA: Dehydrogenase [Pyrococcus abyssi GE5]
MRRIAIVVALLLMTLLPNVAAWNGQLCPDVKYQKSIEAIATDNSTIYASCSYRMVAGSPGGLVGIYYLGTTGAFSENGTKLWEVDSGFVTKLYPWNDYLLVGSMGGLLKLEKNGSYAGRYLTRYKLYDFDVRGSYAYLASGDVFSKSEIKGAVAKVYLPNMSEIWVVNITGMADRVRAGKDVIYVGTGYPSGFSGPVRFGNVIGLSEDGKVLWNITLGEWVRDMELWRDKVVIGTGWNETGHLLVINKDGKVLMNISTFYVENILVNGDIAYVSGLKGVMAVDLSKGKILWKTDLPYRIKVLKLYKDKLIAGGGEFTTKNETVYSVGSLYVLDPRGGKVLKEISMGYVRSLGIIDDMIVVGTGSNILVTLKEDEVLPKGICGPGILLLLALLILFKEFHERS